jgi:hypothetical protein
MMSSSDDGGAAFQCGTVVCWVDAMLIYLASMVAAMVVDCVAAAKRVAMENEKMMAVDSDKGLHLCGGDNLHTAN